MRLHLPMQGTQGSITGLGRFHMLWTAKPECLCPRAQEPQLLSPLALELMPTFSVSRSPPQIHITVQSSHSVVSDSSQSHEPQHSRPPCLSPTPRVYPNSCPLSQQCHQVILSCCPLPLLPSIFPSIRVFSNESALHIRWPKYWSFNFILPMETQD